MPAVPKSMATVTMDLSVRTRLLVRSEEELAVRFRLITPCTSASLLQGPHLHSTHAAKWVTITREPRALPSVVSSLLDCVHCVLVLLVRWAGACHASPASHDEVMKRARAGRGAESPKGYLKGYHPDGALQQHKSEYCNENQDRPFAASDAQVDKKSVRLALVVAS